MEMSPQIQAEASGPVTRRSFSKTVSPKTGNSPKRENWIRVQEEQPPIQSGLREGWALPLLSCSAKHSGWAAGTYAGSRRMDLLDRDLARG